MARTIRKLRHGMLMFVCTAAACADATVGSGVIAAPGSRVHADVQQSGSYPDAADVPPEHRFARIYRHSERVSWTGRTASAFASMEYFGNYGEQMLEISVIHGYSTVGTLRSERHVQDFFPARRVMGNPLQYTVAEDCGQTANFGSSSISLQAHPV